MSIMSRILSCLDILKTLKKKNKSNSPQNKRGGVFIDIDINGWEKKRKRKKDYRNTTQKWAFIFLQPKINCMFRLIFRENSTSSVSAFLNNVVLCKGLLRLTSIS